MFCPNCGSDFTEDSAFCRRCGSIIAKNTDLPVAAPSGRGKTPWEDRDNLGFINAIVSTVKMAAFHPARFYRHMQVSGGFTDPLLFGLIMGMFGLMFHNVWQIILRELMRSIMTTDLNASSSLDLLHGRGVAILAIISPIIVVSVLFVLASCFHLFLKLVNGAHAGFEATFRVVTFACSSCLFFIIPFCGNFIGVIWATVLVVIGLREAHATTGGKVAFAVFFPVLFFCGMLGLLLILFLGAIAASFGTLFYH